jgi:hypothetical protein
LGFSPEQRDKRAGRVLLHWGRRRSAGKELGAIESLRGRNPKMKTRRTFLKQLIGTAACVAAPAILLADRQPDVRGWRFGVWTLQKRYSVRNVQKYYWAVCDCGAERVVGLNQLLSMDALSCDHRRHRGYFYISPDAYRCVCGRNRRFWFNGQGLRIWRCECEEADIRAWLVQDYGPRTSVQFLANMRRQGNER